MVTLLGYQSYKLEALNTHCTSLSVILKLLLKLDVYTIPLDWFRVYTTHITHI